MRAFSFAWKNARVKAPYTAGESLVKPAAVKIARVMCSNAVVQAVGNRAALPGQMHITRLVHGSQLRVSSSAG